MKCFALKIYYSLSDKPDDFNNCRAILEELGFNDATEADCANVRYACECVSRRAAHLAAAGVAVLLNRIGEESVTVAVDGSVYRFHPHFHNLMVEQISQLIKPGIKVIFCLCLVYVSGQK